MMIWPEVIRINRASWHDEVSRSHRYRGVMSSSLLDKPNYLLAGMKPFLRALVVGKKAGNVLPEQTNIGRSEDSLGT
jgi:hypothetical protein